jgi:membrane protein YdbS with pleckstrin-like domain
MSTLRQRIPLSHRKIIKKSFGRLLRLSVIAIFFTLVLAVVYRTLASGGGNIAETLKHYQDTILAIWIMIMLIWVMWEPLYQYLYFGKYFYDMDDKNLIIRKGVLVKREIILPFSKITDVYVDQDIGDVMLAIYDVHISTPTVESGLFAHIDGVSKKGAQELRNLILEKINAESDSSNSP